MPLSEQEPATNCLRRHEGSNQQTLPCQMGIVKKREASSVRHTTQSGIQLMMNLASFENWHRLLPLSIAFLAVNARQCLYSRLNVVDVQRGLNLAAMKKCTPPET